MKTVQWFAIVLLTAVLSGSSLGQNPTASDLLQKGIYTQETIGNLDDAIKIYKQVVQRGRESRSNAAQAQYRLGICLLKKGQQAEAISAFRKVIEEYPEQTELVNQARTYIPSDLKLLPASWADGEILEYDVNMEFMKAAPPGSIKTWYAFQPSKGHPDRWIFENRMYNFAMVASMQVEADRETMKPVASFTRNPAAGNQQINYDAREIRIEVKGRELRKVPVDGPVFDQFELPAVLRRLPLAPGYKVTLPVFSTEGLAHRIVSVTGTEDITTPVGNFHCYQVEVGSETQKYWIAADASRLIVKFDTGPSVSSVLSAVHRADSVPRSFHDDKLGISLTPPAGWSIQKFTLPAGETSINIVQLVDSNSLALVTFTIEPKKADEEVTPAAVRAAAEGRSKKSPTMFDASVRADSWQDLQVGGHPAVRWLADVTDMFKRSLVEYAVLIRTDSSNVEFSAKVEPADFDALRPAFDVILNNVTLK